ncbi:LysM peptidoglycan-binding domain-containing protein [Enterococcus gallinarum]|uniref:LysM peptidoglycan-binding domain-containing protein n=1 Tax=Enterococcus gallinarum TaxID=1353 RepID=UPI0012E0EC8B|nr:LysM peptidoglycan-binding domain-containing protein [Enterococcus gallinarum]MUO34042.1 LysM peptidoglycan-binding domain-containing protein [Enterococcus gallinarum]
MNMSLSRKERRREGQSSEFYQTMRKSAAVVGTTITACSVVAPLLTPVQADAVENTVVRSNFAAPNTAAFITEIATYAQPVAQANDLYASVMIAQAILESGWGRSALSQSPNHNLFGIKGSHNGQTVYMNTAEYLNNQWLTMKEPFKKYPSYKESFEDNARTLRNVSLGNGNYYYAGAWKSNTSSYRDATQWLTGRYATAPNYASSLNTVIQQYGLTKYDTPASGNAGGGATVSTPNTATNPVSKPAATSSVSSGSQGYTVASGDSVWGIANKFGITMDQLCSWNNIRNNFIYPGQKLTINGGTAKQTTNTGTISTTTASAGSYTVASGDSVWSVANKHGITMDQLRNWNNIKNDFIYPGQRLVVKNGTGSKSQADTTTATSSTNAGSYTVASGDSVWSVANKHGITMDQLRNWNNIKNDFIYPGQRLVVKNSGNKQTSSPTTASTSISSSAGSQKYTVASGDSVWSIANKFGITMDQFRSWNNIKNDYVYPGQSVRVSGTATAANQTASTSNYTVVSGDSVWGIADKFGISRDQFIQWNNIKDNFVYPGQSVRVK